jgi:hypothetical protein
MKSLRSSIGNIGDVQMVKAAANQRKQGMSHGFNAVLEIKTTETMPLQLVECGAENG